MSERVPPTLLYLTIVNPTLSSTGLPFEGEEDAEEQAHILFYTSRERAVSRDRMLRQVGLAKALINFSELFNAEEACNNVHAQSRRMIMVTPEPKFWLHACIELARTPSPPAETSKTKGKGKERDKFKANEKGTVKAQETVKDTPIPNDFHDGSVHDLAVRANLLWGYEQFKLTHGSFTSILAKLGREALELQLERFFTVWAWSWDLEGGHGFGQHFGVPLHPYHRSLTPMIDEFSTRLPEYCSILVTSPHHIIPSTKFGAAHYPIVLHQHLLAQIRPSHSNVVCQAVLTSLERTDGTVAPATIVQNSFLRMPTVTLGLPTMKIGANVKKMDVDVRKWSWPGYLTFGRRSGKKSPALPNMGHERSQMETEIGSKTDREQHVDVAVDKNALDDAISSDGVPIPAADDLQYPLTPTARQVGEMSSAPNGSHCTVEEIPPGVEKEETFPPSPDQAVDANTMSLDKPDFSKVPSAKSTPNQQEMPSEGSALTPECSTIVVYLADNHDALIRRRNIFYFTKDQLAIWFIGLDDQDQSNINVLAEPSLALLDKIHELVGDKTRKSESDAPTSATKFLETDDKYIITTTRLTISSPEFTSKSEHLYNAQQLLKKDFDIYEVFSRGQSPQHWHILRRGLGVEDSGVAIEGDVYMEISRKETSLTDVDNDVSTLVRNFMG